MKRLVIRNRSGKEIEVMLEPTAQIEDVANGKALSIEADFTEEELIVDISENGFVSVWAFPDKISNID